MGAGNMFQRGQFFFIIIIIIYAGFSFKACYLW